VSVAGAGVERSGRWWLWPLCALVPLLAALWWWQAARELRSRTEAGLAERRALLQRVEALARTRAELAARLARDPRPIRAENPTLAVAGLQSTFGALARDAGVTVRSTRILAAEKQGGFHRLRLQATVETDHAGLRDWLFALERARPLLAVDSLAIRAGGGKEDRLVVEIVVSNPALLQPPPRPDGRPEDAGGQGNEPGRTP